MLVVLVALYVVLVVLALFSDRLIFQPQPSIYTDKGLKATVTRMNPPGELIRLKSDREQVSAVYLPNSDAKFTILFSHGNAEDLSDSLSFLQMYRNAGFAVFTYDYRGYGTSTGRPTESGVYQDVNAAYDYLTNQIKVPPDRVISMGRSVGCAPAIHLAATQPVAGLIAEAPFKSAFTVLTRVPLLPWDKFNNLREIRKVHAPVLIIHGRNDEVVPFWHGQRVFKAANQPKAFIAIDGAGHNDVLFVAGKPYFQAIQGFAASLPAH
jgi:fermentation-respiration switch protein FrsA (DUF1100 family)